MAAGSEAVEDELLPRSGLQRVGPGEDLGTSVQEGSHLAVGEAAGAGDCWEIPQVQAPARAPA